MTEKIYLLTHSQLTMQLQTENEASEHMNIQPDFLQYKAHQVFITL